MGRPLVVTWNKSIWSGRPRRRWEPRALKRSDGEGGVGARVVVAPRGDDSHSSAHEVFLAAASQRTSQIRLGRGIVLMPPGYHQTVAAAPPAADTQRARARTSPCAGWTGRDVCEHAVGGVKTVHRFATGKGPKSYPKLGTDPLGSGEKLRDGTLDALDHAGALHSDAHEAFGTSARCRWTRSSGSSARGSRDPKVGPRSHGQGRRATRSGPAHDGLHRMEGRARSGAAQPGDVRGGVKPATGADRQTRILNFAGRAV